MRRILSLLVLCGALAGCDQATSPIIASAGPGGAGDGAGPGNGGGSGTTTGTLLISPSQVEIGVAGSVQLFANLAPETLRWSSSNPGVASVSAFGLVAGLSPGVATISARAITDASLVGHATVIVSR